MHATKVRWSKSAIKAAAVVQWLYYERGYSIEASGLNQNVRLSAAETAKALMFIFSWRARPVIASILESLGPFFIRVP